jgi:ElaB/YqjD/DUF883 family membrane-anchored ribosome-binding protein
MDTSGKDLSEFASRGQAVADKAADRAQGIVSQAADAISDAARKARGFAFDTQDSVVTYTREKPVKALMIAATAGAIIVTLIRALSPSNRDA